MTAPRIPVTRTPMRDHAPDTCDCKWCGVTKPRSGNRSRGVCRDCERTERAFGGK